MFTSEPLRWFAPFVAATCAVVGCTGSSGEEPDGGSPTTFVAYPENFAGYHAWSNAPAVAPDDAGDGLHGVGPLRIYWNQSPPHGSKSFPVGTIIVKETEDVDVTQRTVFAMVKRSGSFNSGGAVGWEWFELRDNADGDVAILWRDVPPPGLTYGDQPIGDCDGCHEIAARNDYVWDSALQLGSF